MKSAASVWLRMSSEDTLLFEGFMPAGADHKWEFQKEVTLRAGPVNSLQIWLNGRQVKLEKNAVGGVNQIVINGPFLEDSSNFVDEAPR